MKVVRKLESKVVRKLESKVVSRVESGEQSRIQSKSLRDRMTDDYSEITKERCSLGLHLDDREADIDLQEIGSGNRVCQYCGEIFKDQVPEHDLPINNDEYSDYFVERRNLMVR